MTKGTPARGRMGDRYTHILCRRCGKRSYHASNGICASCGFGNTAKRRQYVWQQKKNGKQRH